MAQSKFNNTAGSIALAIVVASLAIPGCIIDDTGSPRGQTNTPAASVPDTGSPVRRESASKTLNDADPGKPDDATLEVK